MSTRILVTDFGVSGGLDDECADEAGTAYGTMSSRDGDGDALAALERLCATLRR